MHAENTFPRDHLRLRLRRLLCLLRIRCWRFPGRVLFRARSVTHRDIRIEQRAPPGGTDGHIFTPFPQAAQYFAIAERKGSLKVRAFLHFWKVHHRVDQARANSWGNMS